MRSRSTRHSTTPGQRADGSGTGVLRLTRFYLDTSGSAAQKTLYWQRDTNASGGFDSADRKIVLARNVVNTSVPEHGVAHPALHLRLPGRLRGLHHRHDHRDGRPGQDHLRRDPPDRGREPRSHPHPRGPPDHRPSAQRPPGLRRSTMRRHSSESGAALILLLGIVATLADPRRDRGLRAGQPAGSDRGRPRTTTSPSTTPRPASTAPSWRCARPTWPAASASFSPATLTAAYDATYPSGSRPPLTIKVYDNQATVNEAITWDKGGPTAPSTPDGKLWVEASATYNGKTSGISTLVGQVNSTGSLSLPAAAIYTDGNVAFTEAAVTPSASSTPTPPAPPGSRTRTRTPPSTRAATSRATGAPTFRPQRRCRPPCRSGPTAPSTTPSSGSIPPWPGPGACLRSAPCCRRRPSTR